LFKEEYLLMLQDINSPLQVSALIVTRKDGNDSLEVLNVLAHNKTKYGFPGGKLEESESPEEAVVRETEEELGVIPTNIVYRDTYEALTPEGRGIKMFVFTGNVTEDIAPTNEIAELHWLTYEQMANSMDLLTPMTIEHVLPLIKTL
jgi:8-oxo-dGTP pyrophosphatase MutT (NUDIX family)